MLGLMSILGAAVNGSFAEMAYGMGISEITTLVLELGLIIGGIILILKNKQAK